MDIELIATVAGILVSLMLSYVPKADVWFAALDPKAKALVVLGFTTAAVALIWGAGCLEIWGVCITDWKEILRSWIMAVLASQGTYLLSPETNRAAAANLHGFLMRDADNADGDVG